MRTVLLFVAACSVASTASADTPPWVRAAIADVSRDDAPATVLADHLVVEVERDGVVRTMRRYAVRVNDPAGRDAASIRHVYLDGSGKVKALRGWVVASAGAVEELGGREALDVALVDNDVYNEVRARVLDASRRVEAGAIFAAEIEAEEPALFAQVEWLLQDRWPIRNITRTLRLPDGWTARAVTFNAPEVTPRVTGSTYVWQATNLPAVHDERASPPLSSLVPRIAVSYFGQTGERAPGQFSSWQDVASWLHALSDPAALVTDPVARAAREAVAGATTELDKIRAVARFVQRVQYVSIQTGLGRGGGYQPRAASLVLQRRYGDCKDKANLMRAMLNAIGIKSYLVAIYSGDSRYVRKEWPSPQQFNHCIIAVALTQPADVGAVLTHATLGTLLFFDPTDERGAVGDLPLHQQGSLALLQAGGGTLERVPTAPADASAVERTVNTRLEPSGAMKTTVVERSVGREAADVRTRAALMNAADLRRYLEQRVATLAPGASLVRHEPADDVEGNRFTLTLEATSPRYGQLMQGRLMLVRPPASAGLDAPALASGTRNHPVELETSFTTETLTVNLPEGFIVDELPPASSMETPYGRFVMSMERGPGGKVVSRRQFELRRALVPPSEYDALRTFLEQVRSAASAPIVLAKQ
jgi:hypothetical protein